MAVRHKQIVGNTVVLHDPSDDMRVGYGVLENASVGVSPCAEIVIVDKLREPDGQHTLETEEFDGHGETVVSDTDPVVNGTGQG